MEADEVMKLFDSCWFELEILKKRPVSLKSSSFSANPDHEIQEKPSKPELSRIQTIHIRSMSDQFDSMTSFKYDSLSPDTVLFTSKLQTILSGKEVTEIGSPKQRSLKIEVLPKKNTQSRRKKRSESKSLTDLEFEELKGFMDLGFVFSEEDKDSSLASIIPGLQRLGKKDGEEEEEEEEEIDESAIPRPYLSEAWEVLDRRKKKENPLMNWRIPALNNEIDMKDSLKLWAHTVASTVR